MARASPRRQMERAIGSRDPMAGVFAFGDATYFGSLAGRQLDRPVIGAAAVGAPG